MTRVKMPANKNLRNNISSSSSSTHSPSPPSATSTPKKSGNSSSQNNIFQSLSDHYNETEIQSPLNEIKQTPTNTEHANQTQIKTSEISQILIGTVPINVETVHASMEIVPPQIDPIQCSQHIAETTTTSPIITVTPLSTTQFQTKTKTVSSPHKTKRSKSFDSSKIHRSNRIASGGSRKPVIDTTVYCVDDSEDTLSESPKNLSGPEIKTYTRKNSFPKSKTKSSKVVESSEEENIVVKQLKKSTPLIHDIHLESFDKFSKTKSVLPGRVYNFDDLINTNHDLTQYTNPL
jgi:hypothetical protein